MISSTAPTPTPEASVCIWNVSEAEGTVRTQRTYANSERHPASWFILASTELSASIGSFAKIWPNGKT